VPLAVRLPPATFSAITRMDDLLATPDTPNLALMRNPGYVYELAALSLDGKSGIDALAKSNGVSEADLQAAVQTLRPLDHKARQAEIHQLYVDDAREKGYAEGDPEQETIWVLGQRAHAYDDLQGH